MKSFSISRLPVAWRLHLATLVAVLSLGLVSATIYVMQAGRLEQQRVTTLRAVVQGAVAIVAHYQNEAAQGHMDTAAAQAAALTALRATRYLGDEYLWVNDLTPRVIMHPIKPELDGKDVSGLVDPAGQHMFLTIVHVAKTTGSGVVPYLWPRPGEAQPVPKLSYVQLFRPWGWVIGTGVYVDDVIAARHRLAATLALLTLLSGGLVAAVIGWLGRSVAQPVRHLTTATDHLAHNRLDADIPGLARGDEFGALARALAILRDKARERERLEQQIQADRALADRRHAALEQNTQDFGASISGVMTMLGGAADQMRRSAGEMTGAAEDTRTRAGVTTTDAKAATQNLASVAAAAEEMAASANEIGRRIQDVTGATDHAVEAARSSDRMVRDLIGSVEEIGSVVQMISAIAQKTNLLALNATIEAARAGEAGRGFAVVAGEVKALATQTRDATGEVSTRIAAVQASTTDAGEAIAGVTRAIDRVREAAAEIAASIAEQGAATREIAATVQAVSVSTDATVGAMAALSAVADRSGETSRQVLTAADAIARQADTLREEVDLFLAAARNTGKERRTVQRVPLQHAAATLRDGSTSITVRLLDLAPLGVGLEGQAALSIGQEVTLHLPSDSRPVRGRVARVGAGRIGIVFRQDPANLVPIEALLRQLPAAA